MSNILKDAIKKETSIKGFSLLAWGFDEKGQAQGGSVQMPEEAIDQILKWRDEEVTRENRNNSDAQRHENTPYQDNFIENMK